MDRELADKYLWEAVALAKANDEKITENNDKISQMFALLSKIEERTTNIQDKITELKDEHKEQKKITIASFVTKEEFNPVKTIVFGQTGLMLAAVILAVIGMVVAL